MAKKRKMKRIRRSNPKRKPEPELLIDGAAGVYVPQMFVENFDTLHWHIKPKDEAVLIDGPDNEYYWDAWDEVLAYAYYIYEGKRYSLYQDSDLWAIPDDFDFEKAGWL